MRGPNFVSFVRERLLRRLHRIYFVEVLASIVSMNATSVLEKLRVQKHLEEGSYTTSEY